MRQTVSEHIKKCILCMTYNPSDGKKDGFLHLPEKPTLPFETIHIDHLGPLEKTKSNHIHVLVIVDAFTKRVKLCPTRSTKSSEVIKHLKLYFNEFSIPRKIISDRGTAFTSDEFSKFVTGLGIKRILIATAYPQANGQVERYNRTLVPLLAKLVESNQKEWDKLLSEAEFLLNNTYNRSIGDIPSRVLFGVIQNQQVQPSLIKFCEELNRDVDSDINLPNIRENATKNTIKLQKYNKDYHDRHTTKQTKYSCNDLVLVHANKIPGENSKLKNQYKGPYVVTKVLDNDRYIMCDVDGYQVSGKPYEGVHGPENMRLYHKHSDNNDQLNDDTDESYYEDIEYLDESEDD
jgi:hypothetical protein